MPEYLALACRTLRLLDLWSDLDLFQDLHHLALMSMQKVLMMKSKMKLKRLKWVVVRLKLPMRSGYLSGTSWNWTSY